MIPTDIHAFQGIVTKLRTTRGSPYALDVMAEAADLIESLTEMAATIEAVKALHTPERRYQAPEVADRSFDSAEEAAEWLDSPSDDVTFFEICAECGRIESDQLSESGDEWGYRESLWPCRTAAILSGTTTTERTDR